MAKTKEELREYNRLWRRKQRAKWTQEERDEYNKKQREYFDDGHYSVYYLPRENYVGMTNSVKRRMYVHQKNHNRDTTDYVIIDIFDCPIKAHRLETEFHLKGYDGFQYKYFNK